jgi:hypothetical protein
VSGTHSGFDRAERVLDRLASLTHFLRMLIKPPGLAPLCTA